ncbi:ribosome maturation factor RimM [Proteobacteria bacterium 005FR1]|nr:ribosome maturation factor RimM [Proteobacteria bacterium 005FR1]
MTAADKPQLVPVGRIGAVHGVRGWVKIQSFTQPPEQIFAYQPWWLKLPQGEQPVKVTASEVHGNKLVAQLAGLEDREEARRYAQVEILVDVTLFPELEAGEYYWHQLEGLRVFSEYEGHRSDLGCVVRLLETGANDVLVVRGDRNSIDKRERLIPYLPEHTIKRVNLAASEIVVDWDPDF